MKETDILIVTVTKVESQAVIKVFQEFTGKKFIPKSIDERIYFDLGVVNNTKVCLTQSEMGSSGLDASLLTVTKGIESLSPKAVIMVGIAFGVNEKKQNIGDILVSKQLRLYDLQRMGTKDGKAKIILRGDKPSASPMLVNLFKSFELSSWEEEAKVSFDVILSGEKLVDNIDFRQQLSEFEEEAIGGEMEGAGLYVACQNKKVDWILVKSICDWADGNKADDKKSRQKTAAHNSAQFVLEALNFTNITWKQLDNNKTTQVVDNSQEINNFTPAKNIKIDAKYRKKIQNALISAFPSYNKLTMMVRFTLDESLDTITSSQNNLSEATFQLIEWAISENRLQELIEGACKENKGNELLKLCYQEILKLNKNIKSNKNTVEQS